ncbi:hypothetical protein [Nocardia amamiensis]|uniref:aromatic-ring hydroxylase C-terminal domain-containing protein n=1 Tax=Nocardia TaxID=1817 RepID=UPI0033CFEBEB
MFAPKRTLVFNTDLKGLSLNPQQGRADHELESRRAAIGTGDRGRTCADRRRRAGRAHVGVDLGADGQAIFDLLGRGFTLLRFDDIDVTSFVAAAAERGLPLEVVDIRDAHARTLYERNLVLIRPDHHVAWRGDAMPDRADAVLDRVRGAAPNWPAPAGQTDPAATARRMQGLWRRNTSAPLHKRFGQVRESSMNQPIRTTSMLSPLMLRSDMPRESVTAYWPRGGVLSGSRLTAQRTFSVAKHQRSMRPSL